jgi:tetratricopeptide (TPR) repeat protein
VSHHDRVAQLFVRALELHAAGQKERAKLAYLDVLREDHAHHDALNNLGSLAFRSGHRSAARTAFAHAVEHHPGSLVSRLHLADALYDGAELNRALEHYRAALRIDAAFAPAHRGAANVYERLGNAEAAAHHRNRAGSAASFTVVPYRGAYPAIPVLLLRSRLGGNVDTDLLLDDRLFSTSSLFAEEADPLEPLPSHALVFNAVGDAELSARALDDADRLLTGTGAAVVNAPDNVRASGRVANALRMGSLEGVIAPRTTAFPREQLAGDDAASVLEQHGFRWPLLLRAPGYHTGHHFVKVERPSDIHNVLEILPGKEVMAIEFLDARGIDGNARKYCVIAIDGELFPLHLAISPEWKVDYFSTERDLPKFRAEEEGFLIDMRATLGTKVLEALARIASTLGLDYAGIDFALDANRNVLLFEANATMLVDAPDGRSPIRDVAIERILSAVRSMLVARASQVGVSSVTPP